MGMVVVEEGLPVFWELYAADKNAAFFSPSFARLLVVQ
jgi:hypothetical protein